MNVFAPFIREIRLRYYRRALAEINPLHPDVPYIVHRLAELRRVR